ncbi:FKBP-type peptidyl-prolyl cis-trans isomerase [Prolixibacteraceae bacterium Z1-6]|uniref:Peptidyl-prolyl cis-trans isomerase n=1 Tax=Draconibacterium aestuarii TaxID=2998507 RepID=A0A9X3J865_9BACT|nr:FKBP-type peptidyl-prolyl cis-trans isomerase [Prolixibacteraceae bacterium Z1-6]
MKKTLTVVFWILGAVAFFACNDGIDYEKMRQEELAILKDYIDRVHPDAEATSSGLYYFNEEGTGHGDTIKLGDRVLMYYATWSLPTAEDSLLVDQTSGYLSGHRYEPFEFIVGAGSVIAGLEEATKYMQEGTRSHLVIDSGLAYGQSGSGYIGAFQTVLMEVEIFKVIPLETDDDDTEE